MKWLQKQYKLQNAIVLINTLAVSGAILLVNNIQQTFNLMMTGITPEPFWDFYTNIFFNTYWFSVLIPPITGIWAIKHEHKELALLLHTVISIFLAVSLIAVMVLILSHPIDTCM